MYTYQLTGKIHPERVNFTLGQKLSFMLEHLDFDIKGTLDLEIKNSKINVLLISEKVYISSQTGEIETLKNFIEELVRSVADTYGYIRSYVYEVEITNIENLPLGLNYTFGVRGEWNIQKNDDLVNKEFLKILNLFSKPENGYISNILSDFRRSIKYPAMTASFCYRAVETIRQKVFEDISNSNEKERQRDGWNKLRTRLDIGQENFDEIIKFALPNRHGDYPKITYQERENIMNFTRSIIEKLINYISK